MIQKPVKQQELLNMFPLCGQIDIRLKTLRKKAIFFVGISRSGKSTLFNYTNQIQLYGVAPPGQSQPDEFSDEPTTLDVIYAPRIISTQIAEANPGMKSVTLLPNISDRGDLSLVDFPGYLDKRRYNAVIGVSYVIKAAFQIVEDCQFVLVLKNDCFKSGQESELFNSLKGFISMFNFDEMEEQAKRKLFRSVTFAITKSLKNQKIDAYIRRMKNLLKQSQDTLYGDHQNVKKIAYIMEYFSENPEQIYLFKAAEINEDAPKCTIFEDHLNNRSFFSIKTENKKFFKEKNKNLYRLPFAEDYLNMPNKNDKTLLEKEIDNRIASFKKFAKILEQFFKKGIDSQNFFNEKLNFEQEFKKMREFVKEFQVYSTYFDLKQETQFTTHFSAGDPPKKLRTGMVLAQNVFQLYKIFNELPAYNNEDDQQVLESFMEEYKQHLVKVTALFRNAFCEKWDDEQLILQFLFVGVRGCREFSMLYQILPDGKCKICQELQDCFLAILNDKPLKKIQQEFLIRLHQQIQTVVKNIESNKEQIDQYLKYLKGLQEDDEASNLVQLLQYKELKRRFLQIKAKQTLTPEQSLVSIFENFNEHKKTVEDKINELNDEEGDYPNQLNFTFLYQLSSLGNIILNLSRNNNLEEDYFAFDKKDEIERLKGKHTIQQFLISEQAGYAMDIFKYIGDVDSVMEAYEVILKNTPETDHISRLKYMKGMANFCLRHGRIEQAIVLFQKLLKLCTAANLGTEYQQIKQMLIRIPEEKEERMSTYFNDLNHKENIDPYYDQDLKRITEDIEIMFVEPYLAFKKDLEDSYQNSA